MHWLFSSTVGNCLKLPVDYSVAEYQSGVLLSFCAVEDYKFKALEVGSQTIGS